MGYTTRRVVNGGKVSVAFMLMAYRGQKGCS